MGSPAGLAFDWIGRIMYYTNPTAKTIEVSIILRDRIIWLSTTDKLLPYLESLELEEIRKHRGKKD